MISPEYRAALYKALEAARAANNPYLVKSILRALEGAPVTLQEALEEPIWIDESSP